MRILIVLAVAVAAACGSVNERQECAASPDCPVGEFCSREGGERFCWPDAEAPAVTGVTATCPADPCRRDDVLTVQATVTDAEEVLGATVTLGLGGPAVEMTRGTGAAWTALVPLREQPFEAFERAVTVTVTARDGARNETAVPVTGGIVVTRLRWERAVDSVPALDLSAPAVKGDGTVVLGGSNAKLYFVTAAGAEAAAPLTVGSARISAAPAVGDRAIWVGSEDGNVYGVRLDGTGLLPGVSVYAGGAVRGSVAIRSDATKEWAFGASAAGFVGAVSSAGEGVAQGPVNAFAVGPVLGVDGRAYAATSIGNLRAYRLTTSPAVSLSEAWAPPPSVGSGVVAPLAVDGTGAIWTGSVDRHVYRTVPSESSGGASLIKTLPAGMAGTVVVLSNGDVLAGDQGGALHRSTSGGSAVWANPADLGAGSEVLSPIVLTGPASFLVPTTAGSVHALRDDGTTAWSRTLAPGAALREGNLHTPPGQTAHVTSTAYFSASNGKLFAVVVDGALDGTAPWPKAFHDPRNTNRAGAQP